MYVRVFYTNNSLKDDELQEIARPFSPHLSDIYNFCLEEK